jgi:hypothetical protein
MKSRPETLLVISTQKKEEVEEEPKQSWISAGMGLGLLKRLTKTQEMDHATLEAQINKANLLFAQRKKDRVKKGFTIHKGVTRIASDKVEHALIEM